MISAIGFPVTGFTDQLNDRNDALLKSAYLYGVPAFLYNISDIFEYTRTGEITALYWDGGEYHTCKTDLPMFTEFYSGTSTIRKFFPEQFQWLSDNTIFTDDMGLPKFEFQMKMQKSELFQYAIPTIPVFSYHELFHATAGLSKAFLKPIGGRKAKGVMSLQPSDGKLLYATPEACGVLTEAIFNDYYSADSSEGVQLLLEPCLNILNDDGRAVDFRCLVSLNGEGKWQNVLTYARIGGSDVASNFSHGGSLNFAVDVLEQMTPGHGEEKLAEINEVALMVAGFVQKESPNRVSWLGLDICVDRPSNQIYVIEANSKPGTKLVGPWPLALVRAQYFKYLLSHAPNK